MNTVKLMKIVDIHPYDAFYDDRDEYVGTTHLLVVESQEYISGWQATKSDGWEASVIENLPEGIKPEEIEFCAVKLQHPNLVDRLRCIEKYGKYAFVA